MSEDLTKYRLDEGSDLCKFSQNSRKKSGRGEDGSVPPESAQDEYSSM